MALHASVLQHIASKYQNQLLAELIRRLHPVYAAKRPEKNYLHTKHCVFCTEEVIIFKYSVMPDEIRGVVSMDTRTGEIFFKCSDYQKCKARKESLSY